MSELARQDALLAVPAPADLRERLDDVLAGGVEDSVTEIAPLLTATADFLRALTAGSDPVWIEEDADELAHRVTRRPRALPATADELDEAARRAAALALD